MQILPVQRKDGGEDLIKVYSPREFPFDEFNAIAQASRVGGRERVGYCVDFMTFDIETTTIPGKRKRKRTKDGLVDDGWSVPPSAFMYHWQACVGGIVVCGRRWEELWEFLQRICEEYHLGERKRLVCYDHNLGFETAFMYPMLKDALGEWSMFATDAHHPVKITTKKGIEFRCSWKLSNMNLYMLTKTEIDCPYVKSWGDLDYKKIRTADTPLTEEELRYCVVDVLGLYHAIKSKMKRDGDRVTTIPLTSTGYPRRVCRKACRDWEGYREKIFNKCKLSYAAYELCKEAARGGNTHANRFLAGKIWEDPDGYDYSSEYPGVMLLIAGYPMGPLSPYGAIESEKELLDLMEGSCVIFRIYFENLRIKEGVPVPYVPISKCWKLPGKHKADNGRLLSCEGICAMTLTELDYKLIAGQYDWDAMVIPQAYYAPRDWLPEPIRETVKHYYFRKCELKDEIKEEKALYKKAPTPERLEKIGELEYLYAKMKNVLNGLFGMIYTDPVRLETTMDDATGEWSEALPEGKKPQDLLDQFNKSRNSFLCYAWGLYVTAWGRWFLDRLQKCSDALLYSDTDSAKGMKWNEAKLRALENEIIELNKKAGTVYENKEGKKTYLLYPESDGHMKRFITLGAKKYAYEDEDGELHVTVAGVANVKAPGEKLGAGAKELGKIENFRPGFRFNAAGGSAIWYEHAEPHKITVDGCEMLTASSAAIVEVGYTLGITDEYRELLGFQ